MSELGSKPNLDQNSNDDRSEADRAFVEVFRAEMAEWIVKRRAREGTRNIPGFEDGSYRPRVDNRLFGLALGGGGIRSATYSLGVLQGLARLGLLRFVDFMSTASGGGYVGASWSSLTADGTRSDRPRADGTDADDFLYGSGQDNIPFKFVDNEGRPDRQLFDRESPTVRHIRAHANWLAPRLGLTDSWTWVAIFRYLFSTLLNLVLIPAPWVVMLMGATMFVPGDWWNREALLSSAAWALYLMWAPPTGLLFIFGIYSILEGTQDSHHWARVQGTPVLGLEHRIDPGNCLASGRSVRLDGLGSSPPQ